MPPSKTVAPLVGSLPPEGRLIWVVAVHRVSGRHRRPVRAVPPLPLVVGLPRCRALPPGWVPWIWTRAVASPRPSSLAAVAVASPRPPLLAVAPPASLRPLLLLPRQA